MTNSLFASVLDRLWLHLTPGRPMPRYDATNWREIARRSAILLGRLRTKRRITWSTATQDAGIREELKIFGLPEIPFRAFFRGHTPVVVIDAVVEHERQWTRPLLWVVSPAGRFWLDFLEEIHPLGDCDVERWTIAVTRLRHQSRFL